MVLIVCSIPQPPCTANPGSRYLKAVFETLSSVCRKCQTNDSCAGLEITFTRQLQHAAAGKGKSRSASYPPNLTGAVTPGHQLCMRLGGQFNLPF